VDPSTPHYPVQKFAKPKPEHPQDIYVNTLIKMSKEVVRDSVGLVIQYAVSRSSGYCDFVKMVAENNSTIADEAFCWDLCTSNRIFKAVFNRPYSSSLRLKLKARTYDHHIIDIRTTLRHTYAHSNTITTTYLIAMLWLDYNIAKWGVSVGGDFIEEDRNGNVRSRNGRYLVERIKAGAECIANELYKVYKNDIENTDDNSTKWEALPV
ncbi:hypothetical protein BC936DRAFT_145429, partial [Jimgerdemannia flammicorona]